jgi:hypothetical protein
MGKSIFVQLSMVKLIMIKLSMVKLIKGLYKLINLAMLI